VQPQFRAAYNAGYESARFERYVASLEATLGGSIGFRLAETPVFFEADLVKRCERAAREIVAQLAEPDRIDRMREAVPERFRGPSPGALPQFAVVDFAIARAPDGTLVPRVVELQGFPSLYAFEVVQRDAWVAELSAVFPGASWSACYGDLDRDAYVERLRETIVGDCDPSAVVLVDIEPARQKTACDFAATKALIGVEAVDPRELTVRGKRVFRRDAQGREVPVERLYNRIVGDDFARPGIAWPFDLRDDIDVAWAPHPHWFWIWSKASLPYLDHPAVPRTRRLSDVERLPETLDRDYVLKPLFSFAGSGVDVHPTPAAVAAIPAAAREGWCLQEKIAYADALASPAGSVKVELRVMFLRPDARSELVPATNLCRLSRGDMHGVDHNVDATWVGSSIGLWDASAPGAG
jgi:hypothetical protein